MIIERNVLRRFRFTRGIVPRDASYSSCSSSFKNHPSRVETQTHLFSSSRVCRFIFLDHPLLKATICMHACRVYVAPAAERTNANNDPQGSTGVNHPWARSSSFATSRYEMSDGYLFAAIARRIKSDFNYYLIFHHRYEPCHNYIVKSRRNG